MDKFEGKNMADGACCCIGPQNGEPLCPCAMRVAIAQNGYFYVPVKKSPPDNTDNSKEGQST